jgi:peptidoglycan/LPS O-acetylase OafA/YrhL
MTAVEAPIRPNRTLEYQPALDGVRGLAVAIVLGFHLGISWLSGGYLGVSVFFTLSGFLITSLLLAEHGRTARVDLPAFYQRRARRLIPAGLLVLALVCVLVAVDLIQARSTFRRDVMASMFQCLNWVQLFGHQSYGDLFASPSPVAHFWSLGVEEQFYVVWPFMLVLILRFLQRRALVQRLLAVLIGLWVLTAISAPLTARLWSPDAAYYATWARASEVFAGAVLAAVLARRSLPTWCRWLAPLALFIMGVATVVTPAGHGWVFNGGLPLFSIVSAMLIAGLQVPGVTRSLLSARPMAWVGELSYGIYLFHWPVFVLFDQQRTGLHGIALIALRLAITLACAIVSFYALEHPIRQRRLVPSARRLTIALGSAVALVGTMAVVVDVPLPGRPADIPTVVAAANTAPLAAEASPIDPAERAAVASATPRDLTVVALFGDSVPAWLVRDGAKNFSQSDVVVVNGAREACDAMIDMPVARDRFDTELRPPADCEPWDQWYPKVLDDLAADAGEPVDVAALVLGQAPIYDHRVNDQWVGPCESVAWYLRDIAQRISYLRGRGLDVVFVMPARLGARSVFTVPDDFDVRMNCIRRSLRQFVELQGIPIIDPDPMLCPDGNCDSVRSRDGLHVDPDHASTVLDWLVAQVVKAASTEH